MSKYNPKRILIKHVDEEIEKCKSNADDYEIGSFDALVKIKVRSEILNTFLEELLQKHPNDSDLGKAFRNYMKDV